MAIVRLAPPLGTLIVLSISFSGRRCVAIFNRKARLHQEAADHFAYLPRIHERSYSSGDGVAKCRAKGTSR
jgi:hypothetical protein